ncbi:fimbrial protein [Cupriavidus basilensis]|uniref:fimbrial protein n=1 Tax=Cupriavidus basilensis TaxID=68895 RepID=UPI0007C69F86|nr:fimbrial protein [Cupriavidus basilensis]
MRKDEGSFCAQAAQIAQAVRPRRTIAAGAIAVLLSSACGWAVADNIVTAFGRDLAFPALAAPGTVLVRESVTPQQLCGAPTCTLARPSFWVHGGAYTAAGPVVDVDVSGIGLQVLLNGAPLTTTTFAPAVTISSPLEVQLVRTEATMSQGDLAGGWRANLNLCATATPGYSACYSYQRFASIQLAGKIKPIAGTCQTPSQTITMPPAQKRAFTGAGSTTGEIGFEVRLLNCPPGYNRVGYALDPAGGTVANAPGVLPAGSGSSAGGVNIRLTDSGGTPVTFKQSVQVGAYDKGTGGSYAIPMKAAYFQTGDTVTPGTITGAVTVLIDYQ